MTYNYSTPPEQIIYQDDIEFEELENDLMKKRLYGQNMHKNTIKENNMHYLDELFTLEFNEESFKLMLVADNNEDSLNTPVENDCVLNMNHNQLFNSDISFHENSDNTPLDFFDKYKRCIHSTPTPQVSHKNENSKSSMSADLSVDTLIFNQSHFDDPISSIQNYTVSNNKRSFESFWQDYEHGNRLSQSSSNNSKKRKLCSVHSDNLEKVHHLQSPILFSKKA